MLMMQGERYFTRIHVQMLLPVLEEYYEIDLKDSWMYAAVERIYQRERQAGKMSTMGNILRIICHKGDLKASTMKSGIEYMNCTHPIGYPKTIILPTRSWVFQIGGGIAGDFLIWWL
jgi:deoxyhypusine synthase